MDNDELNYLEEKVYNMTRIKTEKIEEDWGAETDLKHKSESDGYKNIDGEEASAWGYPLSSYYFHAIVFIIFRLYFLSTPLELCVIWFCNEQNAIFKIFKKLVGV